MAMHMAMAGISICTIDVFKTSMICTIGLLSFSLDLYKNITVTHITAVHGIIVKY